MAGLDTSKALFVPLLEKKGKVTSAALVGQLEGNPKALVLMMGGNHLPSEAGLRTLANALGTPGD